MRFILKTAFFLGLIAFFIPFGDKPKEANISMVGAFIGAQQAIADLTGFCERAPQACDTGRELAVFAGERITDGAALAYSLVQDKIDARNSTAVAAVQPAPTDPVTTGAVMPAELQVIPAAVEAVKGPMPYMPPKRLPGATEPAGTAAPKAKPATARPLPAVIPVPTPRA